MLYACYVHLLEFINMRMDVVLWEFYSPDCILIVVGYKLMGLRERVSYWTLRVGVLGLLEGGSRDEGRGD